MKVEETEMPFSITNHSDMPTYQALTLGPVVDTITSARKTRELWAASYFFSSLMKEIIRALPAGSHRHILLPALDPGRLENQEAIDEQLDEKTFGAGVWPDRLILVDPPGTVDLSKTIATALQQVAKKLKIDDWKQLRDLLKIRTLNAEWTEQELKESAIDKDKPEKERKDHLAVHRINRLLANLEYRINYQQNPEQDLIDLLSVSRTIHALFDLGFDGKDSRVFEVMEDKSGRIPSLPELGLRDLREYASYQTTIKGPIDRKVMEVRSKDRDAKYYFKDKEEEQLYVDLNKALRAEIGESAISPLILRHKYVAVIVADGDSIGAEVSRVSKAGPEAIRQFSRQLAAFSREAVEKIVEYGGLPVYAGGDDLFFIAPVVNTKSAIHNILQLCCDLDGLFGREFGPEGPSLSFGVSISYYKFPLGEAVSRAYELEAEAKSYVLLPQSGNRRKKNAICFEVRKHSGQKFGATLPLRLRTDDNQPLFDYLSTILKPDEEASRNFLTSFMHKAQTLPGLLANALANGRGEVFRRHHFNEGGKHDKQYLKNALRLGEAIFATHGRQLDTQPDESDDMLRKTSRQMAEVFGKDYRAYGIEPVDWHHANLLFSLLRFKQFTIQPDHD